MNCLPMRCAQGRIYDLSGVRTKPSKKHPEGEGALRPEKVWECRAQLHRQRFGAVLNTPACPYAGVLQAVPPL